MVLVSAAEDGRSDEEPGAIGRLVHRLPALEGLGRELDPIAGSLPAPLRETAHALACDVAAADGRAVQEEPRLLELPRHRLGLERPVAAARHVRP
jgi:hypothetical protein